MADHCKRCKGTGFRSAARAHLGVPGLCFHCHGDGTRATELKTKAAEKETARKASLYQAAEKVIWGVREANGGTATPPRDRRQAAYQVFGPVKGFSTKAYADHFGLPLRDAWVELCRWTHVYPVIDPVTEVACGWEFSS